MRNPWRSDLRTRPPASASPSSCPSLLDSPAPKKKGEKESYYIQKQNQRLTCLQFKPNVIFILEEEEGKQAHLYLSFKALGHVGVAGGGLHVDGRLN